MKDIKERIINLTNPTTKAEYIVQVRVKNDISRIRLFAPTTDQDVVFCVNQDIINTDILEASENYNLLQDTIETLQDAINEQEFLDYENLDTEEIIEDLDGLNNLVPIWIIF